MMKHFGLKHRIKLGTWVSCVVYFLLHTCIWLHIAVRSFLLSQYRKRYRTQYDI